MFLGKIIGTIESTVKPAELRGVKLVWVQPIFNTGEPSGAAFTAADITQAAVGETIFWVDGGEATLAFANSFIPVDATVVGIVEHAGG